MYPISNVCLTAMLMVGAGGMQQKPVTKAEVITATATIQAIDATNRLVTLRTEDGNEESVYVPEDVKRFDELKVGDKVKARYYESYVFQLRKPGEASTEPKATAGVTRGTGASPALTMAKQVTTTVDVVAVDPDAPSITVKTSDGRTITRKIEDKKNLEGVKAGDRIDITFTQSAMISVEPGGNP
jgi:Cu/Ag efflux protein CusF